jgi:hypothetical protein
VAQPKTVIPRKRAGPHNPGGAKPRRVKDPEALSELDREEREFRNRRKAERENSKPLRVMVAGPFYIALLKLAEKFNREPKIQAELCLELGIRFYDNESIPYGGPRPLDHLPEVVEGSVIESGPIPPVPPGPRMKKVLDAGWMGEDAGLPIAQGRTWNPQPEPDVAMAPIEEPPPLAEPEPEPATEEEVVVEV